MVDIYMVKDDDTLDSLALKFNTSKEEILKVNNLSSPRDIKEGIKIVIPQNRDSYYDVYVVEKGDSLYKIAREYNLNPELLAAFNGLNMDDYIYPDEELLIPKNGYSYYLTAKGDSLDSVVSIFDSTFDKLLEENKTIYLMPGQLLVNKKKR